MRANSDGNILHSIYGNKNDGACNVCLKTPQIANSAITIKINYSIIFYYYTSMPIKMVPIIIRYLDLYGTKKVLHFRLIF